MKARIAALSLYLCLGGAACSRAPHPSGALRLEPHPLDLIVLNVELLRADHVGLITGRSDFTPNIDRFFTDGIVFTDASAPAGATYLSATAIATGTEAMLNDHRLTRLGVAINEAIERDGKRLVDHLPTIAETLRDSGYRTAALNEWRHTGTEVFLDRGFDEFVQVSSPEGHVDPRSEGVTLFSEQVNQLLSLLDRCRGQRFYLYFHPNSLHYPFRLPIERARRDPELYSDLETLADVHVRFVSVHPALMRQRASRPSRGAALGFAEDREQRVRSLTRRMYVEQIRYMDDELGRFFAALESGGLLERTIVVLYANHGIGLFDNDVMIMGAPYQSCVHVPLLIRHPHLRSPVRIETPVSLVDLATTLYELLGVVPRLSIPAHSLIPPMQGLPYGRQVILGRDIQTEFIRRGHWKLIVAAADSRELYDLSRDAGETNDLFDPELEIARILEADLRREKLEQHRLRAELSQRLGIDEGWPADAAAP
jgi:arylsulfatase A-like enzyme